MDNLNYWPYTDIHELNLDWIIEKVKALDTKLNDDIDTYVQQYIDEHFEDWTVNANYDPNTQTIVYTNGTGAQQTLGDVIRFAIDNVFVDIKDAIARTAAGNAQTTADGAVLDAAAAQNTADANTTNIGTLSNLNTTDKTSVVNAINETFGRTQVTDIPITDFFSTLNSGWSINTATSITHRLDNLVFASIVLEKSSDIASASSEDVGTLSLPTDHVINTFGGFGGSVFSGVTSGGYVYVAANSVLSIRADTTGRRVAKFNLIYKTTANV